MGSIKITDTSLRDGHQSLWATRMTTDDMLPVLEKLDQVGYHSMEVWGGATFDVCIRYLNEDPWERLRIIRQVVRNTKLQMLVRGQSLVGYSHYPDDIVDKFIEKAADNGIDIFRVFDALNDRRNLETCMKAVKKTGKHVQACVVYTISPVHSKQHFVDTALHLRDMGADSICIKDMAGLISPYASYELVKALKENVDLPVQLHTHYIGGLAIAALIKGVEAGVDIIDTASVPMAFGLSQPPVETLVRALQDTEWDTGLVLHQLFDIATYFEQIRKHKGFERGVTRITDMKVFEHQVPGGMFSNLQSQLEQQKASHRIDEVLAEVPKVREDLGYPPLVTPTSQIIGTQAVLNVLLGERYKMCSREVQDYVRGLYGKPAGAIKDAIKQKIIGNEPLIDVRPADLLEPGWVKAKQAVQRFSDQDEDILTYALFPQVALKFFEYRDSKGSEDIPQISSTEEVKEELHKQEEIKAVEPVVKRATTIPVPGGDEEMNLNEIRELMAMLGQSNIDELDYQKDNFRLSLRKNRGQVVSTPAGPAPVGSEALEVLAEPAVMTGKNLVEVVSPIVGTFYAAPAPDSPPFVQMGDHVEVGQTLCILEAMKLMNEIKAEVAGTVAQILAANAEQVEYGQVLILIDKD